MKMRVAIVSVIVALLMAATGGFTQPPSPRDDINNGKKNGKDQEWVVRYDPTESVGKMFKRAERPAEAQAIRLRITKSGNQYFARLWRFKAKTGGGGYELADKTDSVIALPVMLATEGKSEGRHRKAFKSVTAVSLNDATGVPTGKLVTINGIWQPGMENKARASDRLQLKLYVTSLGGGCEEVIGVMATTSGCEEDPDTDVLEENDVPPSDDAPPDP